jgi:hypothetical protein
MSQVGAKRGDEEADDGQVGGRKKERKNVWYDRMTLYEPKMIHQ